MHTSARDLDAAALGAAAIGGALPGEVEALLARAGALRSQPALAVPLLERALALAPRHPAPLIALYRFHFYGHALDQARAVGEEALAMARAALGADGRARALEEASVRSDAAVRFYLFTLKGLAYLNLRLGALDGARRLLAELRGLDPQDHLGAGLLSHVLARHTAAEHGAQAAPAADAPGYPVRGWAPREDWE